MSLLNSGNAKTSKGQKLGYKTFGLHLAPFNLSGHNVCKDASAGCAAACLNTAGRGKMTMVQNARIKKTQSFFLDRENFLIALYHEITAAIKNAKRAGMIPCFRLNLTSDLPWESIKLDGKSLINHFPDVQFYDYTKSAIRMTKFLAKELPSNYHLTFSRSETNNLVCRSILESGGNVAMVFRNALRETALGYRVIDGDETDLRFLDLQNSIVGLKQKGLAKKDETGFVLESNGEVSWT